MAFEPVNDKQILAWWAAIAAVWLLVLVGTFAYIVSLADKLTSPPVQTVQDREIQYKKDGASNDGQSHAHQAEFEAIDSRRIPFVDFASGRFDLAAQEGMWKATNALVILTIAQSVIGVLGLAFVAATLQTQRGELKEARRVTKSQRAYVLFDALLGVFSTEKDNIIVKFAFRNFGLTPAMKVVIRHGFACADINESPDIELQMYDQGPSVIAPDGQISSGIVVREAEIAEKMPKTERSVVIGFRITNTDIYGEENEFQDFCIRVILGTINISDEGVNPVYRWTYCDARLIDRGKRVPPLDQISGEIYQPEVIKRHLMDLLEGQRP